MRAAIRFKLASFKDFKWWMDGNDLRFTHIVSLMWVRLKGESPEGYAAGSIALIVGPFNLKIHFAWRQSPSEPITGNKGSGTV